MQVTQCLSQVQLQLKLVYTVSSVCVAAALQCQLWVCVVSLIPLLCKLIGRLGARLCVVYRARPSYGGREVHSRFSFAVRGSPSFVPRVFRSCFAVRGSRFAVICASRFSFVLRGSRFVLRGSRFAVICASRFSFVLRGSRFAVICASHFTFVLRGSRFLIRGSYFLVRASQFAVRGSWFVVVLEQGGGSIYFCVVNVQNRASALYVVSL